jgi:hypothetical protein
VPAGDHLEPGEHVDEAERLHLPVQTPAAPQIHRDEFQSPLSSY